MTLNGCNLTYMGRKEEMYHIGSCQNKYGKDVIYYGG